MSNFPKFILGDNTDMPDAMFVVHLEYPRFVLNLDTDEVEWLEEFEEEDVKKVNSEESCPCGSGKPYNKCCGR